MKAAGASSAVRGARQTVAAITHEDALELFSIVGEIEGLAARLGRVIATVGERGQW